MRELEASYFLVVSSIYIVAVPQMEFRYCTQFDVFRILSYDEVQRLPVHADSEESGPVVVKFSVSVSC